MNGWTFKNEVYDSIIQLLDMNHFKITNIVDNKTKKNLKIVDPKKTTTKTKKKHKLTIIEPTPQQILNNKLDILHLASLILEKEYSNAYSMIKDNLIDTYKLPLSFKTIQEHLINHMFDEARQEAINIINNEREELLGNYQVISLIIDEALTKIKTIDSPDTEKQLKLLNNLKQLESNINKDISDLLNYNTIHKYIDKLNIWEQIITDLNIEINDFVENIKPKEKPKINLDTLCFETKDPMTLDDLDELEMDEIFMFGNDEKKHCYELENFYNYYKSIIESGKTIIKDPISGQILSNDDINRLVEQMRNKCMKDGVPFQEAKYELEELDTNKVELKFNLISNSFYHLIIEIQGRPNIDLGYIPADIEVTNNGSGSLNETSGALLANIRQLWDKRKLLTKHKPIKNISCCTIDLNKTREYWRQPPNQEMDKFRRLVYQVENLLNS